MSVDPQVAARLRAAIRDHNRDRQWRIIAHVVLGIIISAITLGFAFMLTWAGFRFFQHRIGASATTIAWGVVSVLAIWGGVAAWRGADPMARLDANTTSGDLAMGAATWWAIDIPIVASPRSMAVGIEEMLIGGPRNLVEAIRLARECLRPPGDVVLGAALLLHDATGERGLHVKDSTASPESGLLLRRLRLVRIEQGADGAGRVHLTAAGREAAGLHARL